MQVLDTGAAEEAAAQQAQLAEEAAAKEAEKAAAKKAKKQRQKAKKQQEQQQQEEDKPSAQHHTVPSYAAEAQVNVTISQLQQQQQQARPSAQQHAEASQLEPANGDISQQKQQQQQQKPPAQQRAQVLQLNEAHATGGISQVQQLQQQQQPEAQLPETGDQHGSTVKLHPDNKLQNAQLQLDDRHSHQTSKLPDVASASWQQSEPERPHQQQQKQQQRQQQKQQQRQQQQQQKQQQEQKQNQQEQQHQQQDWGDKGQQTTGRSQLNPPVNTHQQRPKATASVLTQAKLASPDQAGAGGSQTALSEQVKPTQAKPGQQVAQDVGQSQPVVSVKPSQVSGGVEFPSTSEMTGHAAAKSATQRRFGELSASEAAFGDQQKLLSIPKGHSDSGDAVVFYLWILCLSSASLLFFLLQH